MIAAALLLAGSAGATQQSARAVVVGAERNPGGFNPAVACCENPWSTWMGPAEALRGAFIQSPNGSWVPGPVASASASASGITYTISRSADWYWGGRKVPVTYRDFVYTLDQIVDPDNRVVDRQGYLNIDPARTTHRGSRQVTFRWRTKGCSDLAPCGPYGAWQSLFSTLYPSFALRGMDFNTMWSSCICGSDGKPVSDGPFYLATFVESSGASLRANPYWSGRRPAISSIDFRIYPDAESEIKAFQAHQVDLISPPFGQGLEPLKNASGISYVQSPGLSVEQVDFREGPGASNVLLRAPFMREAIAESIDRNTLAATVFGNLDIGTPPADSALYIPGMTGYRPVFGRWNYDPRRAIALLAAHCSGGPSALDASNTAVWQCSGLPATFSWTWPSGDTNAAIVEAVVKAELRAVGIQIVDRPLAPDVFYGPGGISSGAYDVAELPASGAADPSDWGGAYTCGDPSNVTGFCSAKVDRLLAAGARATNPAVRRRQLQRADAAIAAATPVLPLYAWPVALARTAALHGPTAAATAWGPFWNVERWTWRG
jgi:ABC-type transport system substrate-binding protein